MRKLSEQVPGTFDVVLACDNALPHLLTDDDLHLATANIARKLRPGGLFLASIRDYDRLVQLRPASEMPRIFDGSGGRRITFQVWDWAPDGERYRLHQFLLRQTAQGWQTDHFETEYRALLRGDLISALHAAGLEQVRWHEPDTTGYNQPIVTARAR
jgi:SAM-dependent methyltransferase